MQLTGFCKMRNSSESLGNSHRTAGQQSLSSSKNRGPENHREFVVRFSLVKPQVASSAGLDFVSTYRHRSGVDPSLLANKFALSSLSQTLLEFPKIFCGVYLLR